MHEDITNERYKTSFEYHVGVGFKQYGAGICETELQIESHHLNIGGTVHGGILATLLDITMSGAVTSTILDKSAEQVVTMQMNIHFLRAGQLGDKIIGHAEIAKYGSTIVYVEGEVVNQDGKLLARASGGWFIKKKNK
jgi:acyl-CoA thioesterase